MADPGLISSPEALARRGRAPWWAWALLVAYAAALVAVSWQRWGNPVSDVGLDLVVARDWPHGLVPYRDIRYWYGPLGIGSLSVVFTVLGASLASAAAFGLAVTAAIVELARRLARRWIGPLPAIGVAAATLSIGFSGTLFNYQLPHTFAATTGLVALLCALLALTQRRWALAGLAVGCTALARPEFLLFGLAALGGAALGAVRESGLRAATVGLLRAVSLAALVAVPPYVALGLLAGFHRMLLENIFPLEFIRAVGATFEEAQHPFDLPSLGELLARGAVAIGGGAAALVVLDRLMPGSRPAAISPGGGAARRLVLGAAGLLIAGVLLAAVGGAPGAPAAALRLDLSRLVIAMTPLAAIGLGALAWGAVRWIRDAGPPLDEASDPEAPASPAGGAGPGWTGSGALLAVAGACALRSYAVFTTDVYAAYYAPPVIVVAAILLVRLARQTTARPERAAAGVLALGALSMTTHAVVAFYRDQTVRVEAPVGSFRASVDYGAGVRGVVEQGLLPRVEPGERLLAMPQEPGLLFLTRTRPALYDATFLPGVLSSGADARAARTLLFGAPDAQARVPGYRPPRYAVEGNWNFALWGFRAQGVDVNVRLHRALETGYRVVGRYGQTAELPPKYSLGTGYTVFELQP